MADYESALFWRRIAYVDWGSMFSYFLYYIFLLTENKPESIFNCGYTNSVSGYLAPYEEITYGGYEELDTAHWYGIAECSEQNKNTLLKELDVMLNVLIN